MPVFLEMKQSIFPGKNFSEVHHKLQFPHMSNDHLIHLNFRLLYKKLKPIFLTRQQ